MSIYAIVAERSLRKERSIATISIRQAVENFGIAYMDVNDFVNTDL